MAYSYVAYTATGGQTQFIVPFPYIAEEHVKVKINNVENTSFVWLSSTQIQTSSSNLSDRVYIYRETSPDQRLVDFVIPGQLTEEDLDLAFTQTQYLSQEALDNSVFGIFQDPASGLFSATNKRLSNLADPVDAQDAVTKTWAETSVSSQVAIAITKANEASASATSATASESSVSSSATTATTQATTSTSKAAEASGSATAAAASASAASTSASTATTQAGTATTQATNAASSASSASGSESTATTQASTASTQATQASASAQAAASSASAAATSEANAGNKISSSEIGVSVQAHDADTAKTDVVQTFSASQRGAITALTDAASVAPDLALSNNYSLTLAGNRTLANPTNIVAGQSGSLFITQDGTGSRTLAFGSYWKFVGGTAPTISTAAASIDRLDYVVKSATTIHAVVSLDVK